VGASHPSPVRASLRGLTRTLPKELPGLSAKYIDLPRAETEANAERLVLELGEVGDAEIRYRTGERRVRGIARALPEASLEAPWKRGDLVLVSGGLGGVGVTLARHLAEVEGLRLLLVGRTARALPVSELARSDCLLYEAADVSDLESMRAAVERAEAHFGAKLAGAIHLAGVCPTRLLVEETPETLAESMRAKLAGAWVLGELLDAEAFFVAVGSAYTTVGGAKVGGYTAAGCSLEAFVEDEIARGRARCHHVAFTHWDGLGMSRGYGARDRSRELGYALIDPKRAVASLLACLHSADRAWVVGLDDRRPNVRRHLDAASAPPLEVSAALVGGPRTSAETELERAIADVWSAVLDMSSLDVETSFFALGAESLHLLQAVVALEPAVGRRLAVEDLFRCPTVRALARFVENGAVQLEVADRARKQRAAAPRARSRSPRAGKP